MLRFLLIVSICAAAVGVVTLGVIVARSAWRLHVASCGLHVTVADSFRRKYPEQAERAWPEWKATYDRCMRMLAN